MSDKRRMTLADLDPGKVSREWIRSEIRYQLAEGVHTWCGCYYCGRPSRGGACLGCWVAVYEELQDKEKSDE